MVKYLVISDIHFGHNINKTCDIIQNLSNFFIKYRKDLKDLDIIFLAGDVFDRLLSNNNKDYLYAIKWLVDLLLYCEKEDIILRILEGTPSHDWKQMSILSTILDKLNLSINFKYIDTLCIETMHKHNLTVLYIPDEWKHNAADTWEDVKQCLLDNKLKQVDIAIMHGQFRYQLPILLESSHIEENYLSIVKYYINIGHIHTHSVKDRILAQGSFDRLTHGQEEDKGAVLVTLDDQPSYKFLVNDQAMVFKTIEIDKDKTLEDIDKELKKISKKHESGNIRIILKDNPLVGILEVIRKTYPQFRIKLERVNTNVEKYKLLQDQVIEQGFSITKENVKDLLTVELNKFNLSKEDIILYNKLLAELI